MSIMSKTFGYEEVCGKSHEFLRRGCSYTPLGYSWAGDLLVVNETLLKQSEVNDMRGGAATIEYIHPASGGDCGGIETGIPSQYSVEETDIRTGDLNTFTYHTPKNENPENEENWSLGLYQSLNECGDLMDGGDALQEKSLENKVVSICGTIEKSGGVLPVQAHYLDNRKSYSTDPDNGLLVCIKTGAVVSWEIRYSPVDRDLSDGLVLSDDVTAAFTTALTTLGMTHEDVLEFGMI